MDDLLTTRQVQDILKVDRITVYRMLQDGRIKGVKIGQQWRFPLGEVERLTGINRPVERTESPSSDSNDDPNFPTHCVQTIQDLFSEISLVSALVVDMQGRQLTQISHPSRFCLLIQSSPSGLNACQACWQNFARDSMEVNGLAGSKFFTCHAGLNHVGAPLFDKDAQIGLFLASHFYWQRPDPREETERIRRLAAVHHLPLEEMLAAAQEIQVIDPALHARAESWPFTAARAIMSILHERIGFMERLQQIASLTQFL
jgi:excisionase family DNA binding protein